MSKPRLLLDFAKYWGFMRQIRNSKTLLAFRIPLLFMIAWMLATTSARAQSPKNVLVIHGGWPKLPYNLVSDEQIESVISSDRNSQTQIFNEYMDEKRLNVNSQSFAELLAEVQSLYIGRAAVAHTSVPSHFLPSCGAKAEEAYPGTVGRPFKI
jgi:hypothetical protein